VTRYRWIDARKAEGAEIVAACKVAGVSTSSYYDWRAKVARGPTDAEWDEALLVNEIIVIHRHHDDGYGSPRMTSELRRRGFCVNHKRTEQLMAENGIVAVTPRRCVRTTLPAKLATPLPDLVQRDFSIGEPNRGYVGDITYIRTDEGWLYLASVLDLGSRRLAGGEMAEHMRSELVEKAIGRALALRGCLAGSIFHSDLGSQYLSGDYTGLCERLGVTQSAGRVGTAADNAAAESFWSTLKRELVYRYRFATHAEAKRAITIWINRYNSVRLHSSIGNVPPVEWELEYRRQ
jgi:transposase InsO family protein